MQLDVLQQDMIECLKMHRVRLESDNFFSFVSIFAKYSMPAMLSLFRPLQIVDISRLESLCVTSVRHFQTAGSF